MKQQNRDTALTALHISTLIAYVIRKKWQTQTKLVVTVE